MSSKNEYISPITLVDKMRELRICKQPRNKEEKYKLNTLEFTDEFHKSIYETLDRLASDPGDLSIELMEGFESVLRNFIGKEVHVTQNELKEMKMTITGLVLQSEQA